MPRRAEGLSESPSPILQQVQNKTDRKGFPRSLDAILQSQKKCYIFTSSEKADMKLNSYCLKRDRDLLWLLIKKETTLQYKRTILGIFWSLLNPLLLALVLYIAFIGILKIQKKEFPLFLLTALFPWTWFSNSISASAVSLVANRTLIKKFPFPKHFLLAAGISSQGIHFLFSLSVITLLVYYYGKAPSEIWLLGIPVLLIIQYVLTMGTALAVSAINVYFLDFQFIVAFVLNLLFWVTPIMYQLDTIPERYRFLSLYLNPLSSLMCSWRELFMSNTIHWVWIADAFLFSLVIFLVGLLIFRRLNRRLDEVL
jgi:lipopolysaccharide transport system permease protein